MSELFGAVPPTVWIVAAAASLLSGAFCAATFEGVTVSASRVLITGGMMAALTFLLSVLLIVSVRGAGA